MLGIKPLLCMNSFVFGYGISISWPRSWALLGVPEFPC